MGTVTVLCAQKDDAVTKPSTALCTLRSVGVINIYKDPRNLSPKAERCAQEQLSSVSWACLENRE